MGGVGPRAAGGLAFGEPLLGFAPFVAVAHGLALGEDAGSGFAAAAASDRAAALDAAALDRPGIGGCAR